MFLRRLEQIEWGSKQASRPGISRGAVAALFGQSALLVHHKRGGPSANLDPVFCSGVLKVYQNWPHTV